MSKSPKDAANEKAVNSAFDAFAKKLMAALNANSDLHGSMTLSVQLVAGKIDRFRIASDETEKCVVG